jgi:hypothetical protein
MWILTKKRTSFLVYSSIYKLKWKFWPDVFLSMAGPDWKLSFLTGIHQGVADDDNTFTSNFVSQKFSYAIFFISNFLFGLSFYNPNYEYSTVSLLLWLIIFICLLSCSIHSIGNCILQILFLVFLYYKPVFVGLC